MSIIWVWSHISVTPAGMRRVQKVNKFQTAWPMKSNAINRKRVYMYCVYIYVHNTGF